MGKKLKKFKDDARATREDIQEGLIVALKVTVPEPQFRGQTKRELGTPKVQSITYDVVKTGIIEWVASGRKTHVNAVRDKLVAAIEARLLRNRPQFRRCVARMPSAPAAHVDSQLMGSWIEPALQRTEH